MICEKCKKDIRNTYTQISVALDPDVCIVCWKIRRFAWDRPDYY
jgi:hypothetical protein